MQNKKAINYCEGAMRFAIYGLAFFLPISIALVESFFGVGLLFFFIKRGIIFYSQLIELKRRSWLTYVRSFFEAFCPVASNLRLPIGIFIFTGFFSIIVSKYPLLSIKGFFFKLLEWTFLYFIFVECVSQKKYLKVFLIVFFLSAFMVIASGFFQVFQGIDFIRGHSFLSGRISSSFSHPNDLAAYLIIVATIPLSFGLLLDYSQEKLKWHQLRLSFASLLFFALLIFGLGLTYSRGAWLAFVLQLSFLGILLPKTLKICLMIIFIFLLVFFQGLEKVRNIVWTADNAIVIIPETQRLKMLQEEAERTASQEHAKAINGGKDNRVVLLPSYGSRMFQRLKDFIMDFNASGRHILWKDAIDIIRQHPFGIGLNTYSRIAHEHNPFWSGYPHNCFLQLTAEMGFMGLFAFIWLVLRLFKSGIKAIPLIRDKFLASVLLGALLGIFGFLIQSFFDTSFYSVQLGNLMWMVMGVASASQKLYFENA